MQAVNSRCVDVSCSRWLRRISIGSTPVGAGLVDASLASWYTSLEMQNGYSAHCLPPRFEPEVNGILNALKAGHRQLLE